ncbi:MAG: protein kinase [Myxococcaceae bacterium]|nr:protein kinase [Myxococcaceae bacterium]
MTPERWALVTEVFGQALERPPDARAAFLSLRCGADAGLRAEVDALLESDAAASSFLEGTALAGATPRAPGERLGPWVLERLLGQGGMGEVWLASRADGAYQQKAALKVVRGSRDGELARRFVAERQILAALVHPNISRLLDGGTAPDGSPWLAMELVDGQPLDVHCAHRGLSLRERVRLFLPVCEAVSFAHRRLVVHRDLKPANVLVAADGTPRLLDFGIAKLLGAQAAHATHAGAVALTPAFASPEQIRNEPVTTSTDVFSLGVMLYGLVAGHGPWGEALGPEAALRAVLDAEPLPSGTDADLDAVLRRALEKDPRRRYPSVESFAQELDRWLGGHPVEARAPSALGRALKAARRRPALAGLGAAVFLSLTGGLLATSWQARIAARERARAQKRFDDVRGLANALIFEVHDAILYLPGATSARAVVAKKAVAYLDELAQDTGDPAVRREVVAGYQKVAEAMNYDSSANLGDAASATRNYERALALAVGPGTAADATPEDRASLVDLWLSYGTHLRTQGELKAARTVITRALAMREQLLEASPRDPERRRLVANAVSYLGDVASEEGRPADALAAYGRVRDVYAALVEEDPTNVRNRWGLVCGYGNSAAVLRELGRLDEALASAVEALRLTEALRVDRPDHYTVLQGLGDYHQTLGEVHEARGELDAARLEYQRALAQREALAARDANDVAAASSSAKSRATLAALAPAAEAAAAFTSIHRRVEELVRLYPGSSEVAALRAEVLLLEATSTSPAACDRARAAVVQLAALVSARPQVASLARLHEKAQQKAAGCGAP